MVTHGNWQLIRSAIMINVLQSLIECCFVAKFVLNIMSFIEFRQTSLTEGDIQIFPTHLATIQSLIIAMFKPECHRHLYLSYSQPNTPF